jgi:hypothetical protein
MFSDLSDLLRDINSTLLDRAAEALSALGRVTKTRNQVIVLLNNDVITDSGIVDPGPLVDTTTVEWDNTSLNYRINTVIQTIDI